MDWKLSELLTGWIAVNNLPNNDKTDLIKEAVIAANYKIHELELELAALKEQHPWTYIMTDAAGEVVAETLPERGSGLILFCIRDKVEEDEFVTAGSYDHDEGRWYLFTGEKMFMAGIVIYAWQPLPARAIYGGEG